jgi:hypothetical protein
LPNTAKIRLAGLSNTLDAEWPTNAIDPVRNLTAIGWSAVQDG